MCKNKVMQVVSNGYGYKEVQSRCGTTGISGGLLICGECQEKAERMYPQGWTYVPGDTCRHGNYVGDAYGPDYICGQCEEGVL